MWIILTLFTIRSNCRPSLLVLLLGWTSYNIKRWNIWYNWSVTAVIWDQKCLHKTDNTAGKLQLLYETKKRLHTTDDTTGKLQLLYETKNVPHTTDDTTGKLQLLYETKNVSIKQIIQLVSYTCYMRQKSLHTTDCTTGK